MINVGVVGARGRMGREVCAAVERDKELALVARVDRGSSGQLALDELLTHGASVAVDFTHPDVAMDNVRHYLAHGVHAVIGTTGIDAAQLEEIRALARGGTANVLVAPNFAISAVLMIHLSSIAARFMPQAEIVELAHDKKVDAPSGTALKTAAALAKSGGRSVSSPDLDARGALSDGIRIHSVRLPGLVSHQEVIFGGPGQSLTIRQDSFDRSSFMPGVIMAIKAIPTRPGFTYGLEVLLGL